MALAARIGADAVLQALRLADIEHLALRIDHAIDAGRVGQGRPEPADHLHAGAADTTLGHDRLSRLRCRWWRWRRGGLRGGDRRIVGGIGHGSDVGYAGSPGKISPGPVLVEFTTMRWRLARRDRLVRRDQ